MLKASEIKALIIEAVSLKNFLPAESPARYELTAALWHLDKAHQLAEEQERENEQRRSSNILPFKKRV